MNSPLIQLLVLAGIAVFLILRLKSVLGSREGFEKPSAPEKAVKKSRKGFEVIEGGPDRDITDHVPENDEAAQQLAAMKRVEPEFSVTEFVQGARGAYEMIVMGFERGNIDDLIPFLAEDVYDAFAQVVEAREEQGLQIESEFVGVRETSIADVRFDKDSGRAKINDIYEGTGQINTLIVAREILGYTRKELK